MLVCSVRAAASIDCVQNCLKSNIAIRCVADCGDHAECARPTWCHAIQSSPGSALCVDSRCKDAGSATASTGPSLAVESKDLLQKRLKCDSPVPVLTDCHDLFIVCLLLCCMIGCHLWRCRWSKWSTKRLRLSFRVQGQSGCEHGCHRKPQHA